MVRVSAAFPKIVLWTQLIIACGVISVNGYNKYYKYSNSPGSSLYQYNNQVEKSRVENYVDTLYEYIEVNARNHYDIDLVDDVVDALENFSRHLCKGYIYLSAYIMYGQIDPNIPGEKFYIIGMKCNPADDKNLLSGPAAPTYVHIIDTRNEYLDDLKNFHVNNCQERKELLNAGFQVYVLDPAISKSGKNEIYFTNFECYGVSPFPM